MFLISRLLQAAQAWRRRRGGPKTAKRPVVAVEQLDHRQLLSVNFTGNVAIDFPATQQPGVVIFNSSPNVPNTIYTPNVITPDIPSYLQGLIPQSGFALSEIAVSYNPADDILSVGFNQPDYPSTGTPVIPGDADGNGVAGTVDTSVVAAAATVDKDFVEFPNLGGSDEMAAFLDLANPGDPGQGNPGTPDIVAGFSPNLPPANPNTVPTIPPKTYEVAAAIPNPSNPTNGIPMFDEGTLFPNNTGNFSLQETATYPNFEFNIKNFSQLYLSETGKALTPSSVIGIGAFAGSQDDGGVGDAFFPENTFTLAQVTSPPANPEPSPPILINPHEHRIIDTNHRDLVRVSIFGTSGFPVSEINPATVELDGVHAIAHINRKVHRDEFPFQTYVFVADQLTLPVGLTTATLTGDTYSGVPFQTQKDVLNVPDSAKVFGRLKKYMGNASYYESLVKFETRNPSAVISVNNTPVTAVSRNRAPKGAAAIKVDYTPKVSAAGKVTNKAAETVKVRPVISLNKSQATDMHRNVPTRLRHSMADYLK